MFIDKRWEKIDVTHSWNTNGPLSVTEQSLSKSPEIVSF